MMNRIVLPEGYEYDKNGFIKQTLHVHFPYTIEYKAKQGTNVEMSHLRLGWLAGFFKYENLKNLSLVDIGCGNGVFVKCCQGKFRKAVGYDLVGESISKEELLETDWDIVVLSDVLEHFEEVEDLFSVRWRTCMLSFPETPVVSSFEELSKWRHFKPNEHLYYLTSNTVVKWLESHPSVNVIGENNFEDMIRKRWDKDKTNISSIIAKRDLDGKSSISNNPVS